MSTHEEVFAEGGGGGGGGGSSIRDSRSDIGRGGGGGSIRESRSDIGRAGSSIRDSRGDFRPVHLEVWDVGGNHYFAKTRALIFVVDSVNVYALLDAKDELARVLGEDGMRESKREFNFC